MGIKQDAWTTQVNLFDSGVGNYINARDDLLDSYTEFNVYLNNFLTDSGVTQQEWDSQVLNIRQKALTKSARFEDGILVRPQETQNSFQSTWSICEEALRNLRELSETYVNDLSIPNNVRNSIGQIDFDANDQYIVFSPPGGVYAVKSKDGVTRFLPIQPPHYWLIINQFSSLIKAGRTEPTVGDDSTNAKTKLSGISFLIVINDSAAFAVSDDARGITGID